MRWYKELSKAALNAAVLSIPLLILGFVTQPQWKWYFPIFGVLWVLAFVALSRYLWNKGEDD